MAAKDSDQQRPNPNEPGPTQTDEFNRAQPPGEEPNLSRHGSTPSWGGGSLNDLFGRAGSLDYEEDRSSTAMRALKEVQTKLLEADLLKRECSIQLFDRDTNEVGLPAILIKREFKVRNKVFAVVRPLVMELTSIKLPQQEKSMGNGQRISIPTLPVDVATSNSYWGKIERAVGGNRGIANYTVQDAGILTVPADYDFDNTKAVARLLVDSANRIMDVENKINGERPVTLDLIKGQTDQLSATLNFEDEPRYDLTGIPKRSDIRVQLAGKDRHNNVTHEDFYSKPLDLNEVSMYVNLEYDPDQAQPGMQGFQQQQPLPPFVPSVVITDVRQSPSLQANTPELFTMALSNAYRVTAGMSWANTFYPSVGREGRDPRDIGALGLLTPKGKVLETRTDTFSDQDFRDWMGNMVRPEPDFVIDVDPAGENSLVESYLLDAAMEGPNQKLANDMLVEAADNLTNGHFSQYFRNQDGTRPPVVLPYGQEINIGYYFDETGSKRDLRDLDVLAMLNYCDGDLQVFMDWYGTYCNPYMDRLECLDLRERFERRFLGQKLHITSRAQRLVFTPEYIKALDAGVTAAGCAVDVENVTTYMTGQRFTGNPMAGRYAVSGMAQSHGPSISGPGGQNVNGRYPGSAPGSNRYI